MFTRLILIRHGETEWNVGNKLQGQADSPLTEKGRDQVREAGKILTKEKIDFVYVSSLGRTIQTYEELKPFIRGKPVVHISDQLVERSFGKAEGMTIEEAVRFFPEDMVLRKTNSYLWKLPDGENYRDLRKRAVDFTDEIIKIHKNKTILLVTHGGVVKMLILHYKNLPLEPWPHFLVDNAAVNILKISDDGKIEIEREDINFQKPVSKYS